MKAKIFQVDAFTTTPFTGNPAGICLLDGPVPEPWMQSVAAEMNLSETAFLYPELDGYRLRWFTPRIEVQLCGHATLASAHTLWACGMLPAAERARFYTLSGLLTAERHGEWIEMDFPARFTEPAVPLPGLLEAINARPVQVNRWNNIFLLELENEKAVCELLPNFNLLAQLPVRSVIVTAGSDSPQFDIVSRYFAPAVGVNEDPVTGSAHCALAPYWSAKLGRQDLMGFQASSRGGVIGMRLACERVILRGQAVTVLAGELSDEHSACSAQ